MIQREAALQKNCAAIRTATMATVFGEFVNHFVLVMMIVLVLKDVIRQQGDVCQSACLLLIVFLARFVVNISDAGIFT